ncbi:group II intron reverse transcriptase/maturase [Ktedonobacter racemifer]|uniref:RNA-directed DNA polymerase (Reverse transcriptase) n=1 Tax=Ktedonobacter racemifer DSM 44963 TaxID=485913 RepID=D6THI7_KTERA|nr:RNA-directed DNA polymerase (Reverse transcriptase) [Ktedonobacter racemifer DSM 44963]EFH88992.1 RNA-directed DNA polymerase (Reverse transcriptase) [Ktedonobacter racemifer DSM 44963]
MESRRSSTIANRKAPRIKKKIDPESEAWNKLPWRKFEQHVYRIQKRIYRASQRGNQRAVQKLQKLLMKSEAARLLAVRRVSQDNQGKKTAGVDGVKNLKPQQRRQVASLIHPKQWPQKVKPVRRVFIPKPGKNEQRPLGIPTMYERGRQCLVKSALEPEWEARFEVNSYGFRPGRSCHDAIAAIFLDIGKKAKYVLDADIRGCFDNIDQTALLKKLQTYPRLRQAVQAWLKSGVMTEGEFTPTTSGTPQGGVVSPLLMNIALYGLEEALKGVKRTTRDKPQMVRYADDLVVFHSTLETILEVKTRINDWLRDMGLELKPSKTRISHTLTPYEGNVGFEFLGFSIRQYPVGKNRTGTNSQGTPLGFKTIIKPSKEAVKRHIAQMKQQINKRRSAPQGQLIKELSAIIRGWSNYYRTVCSKAEYSRCDYILQQQLWSWAIRRHPNKNRHWIRQRYWKRGEGQYSIFATSEDYDLRRHDATKIQRHVKVKGAASPYDGNLMYWSQRLKNHPTTRGTLAMLLLKQQGKCRWCDLQFREGDQIEIDHITPKSEGGGEELSNKCALHRHCHDQRHGTHNKGHMIEEPSEEKSSCSVLQTSGWGDPCA